MFDERNTVNAVDSVVRFKRKVARRLNWRGLYIDLGDQSQPVAVVAGYTRSGTTFLGGVLSNILGARPVHEPLNPLASQELAFFNERESRSKVSSLDDYRDALKTVFSKQFKGSSMTNTGSSLVYRGRIVKVVRANHYLDVLSDLLCFCTV